jgi:hypothetical protein
MFALQRRFPVAIDARTAYNYEHFMRSEGVGRTNDFKNLLRAGEEAPDFELPTPEGERIRLSSFRGKSHVLLEFGSIT